VPLEGPGPVWATAGDFNRDGKLDLAAVDGTSQVGVLLQAPLDRERWTQQPSPSIGTTCYFILSADWDGDGDADLAVADPGSAAYFLSSRGDGTFERGRTIDRTSNSRAMAAADFDGDGRLDIAAINDFQRFSVHRGGGDGTFAFLRSYPALNVHDMVTLDYDGDGRADIMVKTKETGIFPFRGKGDGTFELHPLIANLTPRGPIAAAEFNHDGKGDLVTNYAIGISAGDATYRKTLALDRPFMPVGAADFSGDGHQDAAVTTLTSDMIEIYRGNGDGTFLPAVAFPLPGPIVSFIGRDLDGNRRVDLIAVGPATGLAVIWGSEGERFLAAPLSLADIGPARAMATGDFDRDGALDLFFSATGPGVRVLLRPGMVPGQPQVVRIDTRASFSLLEAADLDGDRVPDLAGADVAGGKLLVALLEAAGGVRREMSLPAGIGPADVIVGRIDDNASPDLTVVCQGSDRIALFLNPGDGTFSPGRQLETITNPRAAALGEIDGDGLADLAVISASAVAVHRALGNGDFAAPVPIEHGGPSAFTDIVLADIDGDGVPDLSVADSSAPAIRVWRRRAEGGFGPPETVGLKEEPSRFAAADLDGDGRADLIATSSTGRSAAVLLHDGGPGFGPPLSYGLGLDVLGHRLADFDGDGALDLAAFESRNVAILFGRSAAARSGFRRGDATGEGVLDLTDPIALLGSLFLGEDPLNCADAADANDDGWVDISDAVGILLSLFLGTGPLPPPGPGCGPDPTLDSLAACGASCL